MVYQNHSGKLIWLSFLVVARSRRRSAAVRLLGLRFRILPGAWLSVVSVVCCQVEVSATS